MVFHAQTEHIETHYQYIHENIQIKEIYLVLTHSKQVINIVTNFFGRIKYSKFRKKLGIQGLNIIMQRKR
jgi:hypothetical protein